MPLRAFPPPARRLAAAVGLAACSLPSIAAFVPSGGGNYAGEPLYRALVFGGIDTLAASSPGYLSQDIFNGVDYASNTAPLPVATGGGTVSASGATITGSGWTSPSGFMAARNHATATVTNAQTTDDYYLVAGQGGTTRVHVSAGSIPSSASFTWTVTGQSSSSGPGVAQSRLDFDVTTSPGTDWNSFLFGPGGLQELGPGTYTYDVPLLAQEQDLFLYFWSSAFVLLAHDTAPQGSGTTMTADFGSTFVLTDVVLLDANGQELADWTMTDAAGTALFDETGRLATVDPAPTIPALLPEPGSGTLMLAGFAAWCWTRRRGARLAPAAG